jgi:hypothetical protein
MDNLHDEINTKIEDKLHDTKYKFSFTNFIKGVYYLSLAKYFDPVGYKIARHILLRLKLETFKDHS